VILTNGEIDAIAGLLSMREGWPFTIYAHEKVLATLKSNSVFNVLSEKNVKRQAIAIDKAFEPALPDGTPSGIEILPFEVTGKGAWYLEGERREGSEAAGDTLGLRIRDKTTGKFFFFIAACAEVTDDLKSRLKGAALVFFDGTVWRDDEMIAAGLATKTGRSMGHISMSGEQGAIAALAKLGIERKIFLHINNSNPALLHNSEERRAAEQAGWQIPADGTEIVL
jgi:pyrroloquinoline quinone biosynthesis protein B